MRNRFAVFAATSLLLSIPLHADVRATNAADVYKQLQTWRFSTPVPIPAGGVTITRDTAKWVLQSGTVRLMEPAAGRVTGFVFEGQGRFTMTVPDRFELAQLRRFTKKPDLAAIDEPITQVVFRTSDESIARLFPAAGATYEANGLAEKRHEYWLAENFDDNDARVVAAMLNPNALFIAADINTAGYDWLTYEYDSNRGEEITLSHFASGFTESWLSLDRPEDRTADGRPSYKPADLVALQHIDADVDLTKYGRGGEVGTQYQRSLDGHYVVDATFTGLGPEMDALDLSLWAIARDVHASEEGKELTVIRDRVGKRKATLDNKYSDDDFIVVLPAPIRKGEKRTIRFEYDLETANYAPGDLWYPTVVHALDQPITAKLTLRTAKKNELRSMGRMEEKKEENGAMKSIWIIDRPTRMVTFSTATRFEEVKVDPGNIPPVISFGPGFQMDNRDKVRNVAADVANSMQFFQQLLEDRIEGRQFYVTSIASNHGQAFDGFLHMGEFTYAEEHPGASELFRAHEVAHEWFGHKIGWKTYRDQWLSEALAEYASMLFVQGFVKGGDKYFNEILDAYESINKGSLSSLYSKFNRPWLLELNGAYRDRLGPIGHGWRASTKEIPAGYTIQTYHKGPLVLHMLRSLLRYRTGNDQLFIKILRDYVHEYSGKAASTDDFRAIVERDAPGDWRWFFDSWVYSADLPTYNWSYDAQPADGNFYTMTLKLRRSDVAPDFMTIIPVKVEYVDGKAGVFFVVNKTAEQTVTQKLPAKPKSVTFGPDHSLLGTIKRD